jgi:general secretion pathway protein H
VESLTVPVAGTRCDTGFTLIEILVVLVVLSIGAGLVVANLERDPRRVAMAEARRLAGALEHASSLAQWTNRTLGVSVLPDGYRFWERGTEGRWVALGGSDTLAPRALPAPLSARLVSYAGAVVDAGTVLPLRPTGRNEPFVLLLEHPDGSTVLATDPLNRVTIQADSEPRR